MTADGPWNTPIRGTAVGPAWDRPGAPLGHAFARARLRSMPSDPRSEPGRASHGRRPLALFPCSSRRALALASTGFGAAFHLRKCLWASGLHWECGHRPVQGGLAAGVASCCGRPGLFQVAARGRGSGWGIGLWTTLVSTGGWMPTIAGTVAGPQLGGGKRRTVDGTRLLRMSRSRNRRRICPPAPHTSCLARRTWRRGRGGPAGPSTRSSPLWWSPRSWRSWLRPSPPAPDTGIELDAPRAPGGRWGRSARRPGRRGNGVVSASRPRRAGC